MPQFSSLNPFEFRASIYFQIIQALINGSKS